MRLDFIEINTRVSPDEMEAYIDLKPIEGTSGVLTIEHLTTALEEAGVTRGISHSALNIITEDFNANPREFSSGAVATGEPPVPEKSGPLRLQVKHLTDPEDIKFVSERKYFWEIITLANKFQRVDNGTVIGRRTGASLSIDGYTVRGAVIEAPHPDNEDEAGKIHERDHVFVAGNIFTAAATGIVYIDESGIPGVVPINFDGVVELDVAQDAMTATLTVYPAGERGIIPSDESIRTLLKSRGVIFGIDEEAFGLFLIQIRKGLTAQASLVVARGIRPIKGDDGIVDFCFNIESAPTPTLNSDGSVDYKNINIVASVSAGAVLARLKPPKEGTPGMDIYGKRIPAVKGSPAVLPVGTNTAVTKADPTILVAVTDGIPRFDGTAVNISEGYSISGDVDYSTGNVNYAQSVAINGDIKSGFAVTCGGDLQVSGTIEDCMLNVGGNVLGKCGFVGNGKGVMNVAGDVSLVFCKNQTIVSQGSINIAKEVLNCNIKALKSINIYGQRLSAAGGILIAVESIVLKTVGNISGVHTILQIDPEPALVEEVVALKKGIAANKVNLKKVEHAIKNMPPDKRDDAELLRKLKNTAISIRSQIAKTEIQANQLAATIDRFENSFIRVDRIAYPGTEFRFGEKHSLMLHEMISGGKTIRVVDNEIKIM